MYSLLVIRPGSLPFLTFRHSSTQSSFVSAVTVYLVSSILMTACSHHRILTHSSGALSNPSHMSSSDCVSIYCATVVCCRLMYCSIIWNPASSLSVAAKFYSRFPSVFHCGIRTFSRRATWYWKPPNNLTMQGVTTQVSETKINTACTTALKKKTDTCSSDPPC